MVINVYNTITKLKTNYQENTLSFSLALQLLMVDNEIK